jgi:tetratricopeptide (TPR) repeat protein
MSGKLVLFSSSVFLPLVVLLLAAMSAAAQGATAGELLEKAIYAEETVGNLDEAIKLYEQVIAESKDAKSAAAKAQYRLGLIYEKQGNADEATAAFRTVIENYPDEKEIVAQARKRMPSEPKLLPAPWVDGEEMHIHMKLASGMDIGTMIYRVDHERNSEHGDTTLCWTRGLVLANHADSVSWVLAKTESFEPIKSFWKHSLLGEAKAEFDEASVRIDVVGKDKPVTVNVTQPVFDNEQCMQLFRRLPLEVGYKSSLTVVTSLGSGKLGLSLEVPEVQTIEVPAGKFECFKLVLNIGQTFWISKDEHRYVVRFEAGGVTADLQRVEQRAEDATAQLKGDGYALTLPKGWHGYSPKLPGQEKKSTAFLLDPNAVVQATVSAGDLSTLSEADRASAKVWTESAMKSLKDAYDNFAVRASGIEEFKAGELTGTAVVADYTDDDKKHTLYGVAFIDGETAVNLRFEVAADKFDELKSTFEAIAKSVTME